MRNTQETCEAFVLGFVEARSYGAMPDLLRSGARHGLDLPDVLAAAERLSHDGAVVLYRDGEGQLNGSGRATRWMIRTAALSRDLVDAADRAKRMAGVE